MGKTRYIAFKEKADKILSVLGMIVSSPIVGIACVAILIDDPKASPIYSQTRVGENGEEFTMYKLRTMRKNADKHFHLVEHMNESDGPVFKIKDDPRITKIGKFLRRLNIDELPQFYNVYKGDMALVGPRPPLPGEVKKYKLWQTQRLTVKPGITCYWQIADNRNDISFDDWCKMDIKYIEEMGPITDLMILIKTVGAVIKLSGR